MCPFCDKFCMKLFKDGWDWQWQAYKQTEKAHQLVTIATGSATTSLETSDKPTSQKS